MESTKNGNNTFLVVVIVILVFIVGFLAGQLFNKKEELKETPKVEEKVKEQSKEEKDDSKDEKGENTKEQPEKEKEESKDENDIMEHYGCSVCDSDGSICCGTSPEKRNYEYIKMDILDGDYTTDEFEIFNDNYKYKVKGTKKGSIEKVIVNGKTIFERPLTVEKVFLLDNGMIGVQYYDKDDQAKLRKRDYYNTNLSIIKTIEGIKNSEDIFKKEFEYIEIGKCIKNEYKEIKVNKATINKTTIDTAYVRTDKEDGCAGMA